MGTKQSEKTFIIKIDDAYFVYFNLKKFKFNRYDTIANKKEAKKFYSFEKANNIVKILRSRLITNHTYEIHEYNET